MKEYEKNDIVHRVMRVVDKQRVDLLFELSINKRMKEEWLVTEEEEERLIEDCFDQIHYIEMER